MLWRAVVQIASALKRERVGSRFARVQFAQDVSLEQQRARMPQLCVNNGERRDWRTGSGRLTAAGIPGHRDRLEVRIQPIDNSSDGIVQGSKPSLRRSGAVVER